MKDLTTNWKLPDSVSVVRTDSYYYDKCPEVRKDLPCIVFSAQFTTKASGRYSLSLEVFRDEGLLVWNSANFEIVNVSTPTPYAIPSGTLLWKHQIQPQSPRLFLLILLTPLQIKN